MNRDVERGAAVHKHAAEQAFDRVSPSQHGGAVTEVMDRLGREDLLDQGPDHALRRVIEEVLDVGGDPRHLPVRGQGQQKPDRLDGSGDMNGLAITIGQVDRGGGRHYRSAPGKARAAFSNTANTEQAPSAAVSRSSGELRRSSRTDVNARQAAGFPHERKAFGISSATEQTRTAAPRREPSRT